MGETLRPREQQGEQTGHTPGPWQWYWRTNAESEADCGVLWEKREGQAYSVCRAPRYQTQQQWEADARLIVAAPDLLRAAEAVLPIYEELARENQIELGEEPFEEEPLAWLRAAIAKARGESEPLTSSLPNEANASSASTK